MSQSELGRLVFVSHSSKDIWIAKQIAKEIKFADAQPFLDEAEVEVGDEFKGVLSIPKRNITASSKEASCRGSSTYKVAE